MKGKIAVIEDDIDLRSLLHNALRQEGYDVQTYANGDEFLLSSQIEGRSDLYVIDINLGGITGFEICSRIKEDPESKNAIVILISANPEVQQLARDVHADDYILKPFSQRELIQKIEDFLDGTYQSQAGDSNAG